MGKSLLRNPSYPSLRDELLPHTFPWHFGQDFAELSRVATFSRSLRDNVRLQISSNKTVFAF